MSILEKDWELILSLVKDKLNRNCYLREKILKEPIVPWQDRTGSDIGDVFYDTAQKEASIAKIDKESNNLRVIKSKIESHIELLYSE